MASTIKVDNVQNQPGTNIINKCSVTTTIGAGAGETVAVCAATVNLGRSGGTVNLTSGATQTGFGRTGTVDWETSIQTGTVTAATGKGYFVDTTSAGITVNLPAAAVGSIVAVSDYASTSASNNISINPNGSEKINGINAVYTMATAGLAVTLVYADATRGWKSVTGSDADATGVVPAYIAATGGTPCSGAIVCTNYKVHTFTGPGTFCVSAGSGALAKADYMVIAGAGGAGGGEGTAGGGAGGYRESNGTSSGCYTTSPLGTTPTTVPALTLSPGAYPIDVGGGGPGGGHAPTVSGTAGTNSIFSTITSTGGGGGGSGGGTAGVGTTGGSGGGGGGRENNPAGNGNTPPVSPPQGQPGGNATTASGTSTDSGGGGGGATTVGTQGTSCGPGGNGGTGATSSINATPTARAGGGAGGSQLGSPGTASGGGAAPAGSNGTSNTGGGGAGQGASGTGGSGGSGVVIIRYKFQ